MTTHVTLPLWQDRDPEQKAEVLRDMLLDLYGYVLSSARHALLQLLEAAAPADAAEARSIAQMQELIVMHSNILAQNCEVGHMTGSALIVDPPGGRVLLHHHRKLGLWLPVGGHAEFETDLALVAMREAREESGLLDLRFFPDPVNQRPVDFDVHTIPQQRDRPAHLHLDFRYLLATHRPDEVRLDPAESLGFVWMTVEDALVRKDLLPDVKRLVGKAQSAMLAATGA